MSRGADLHSCHQVIATTDASAKTRHRTFCEVRDLPLKAEQAMLFTRTISTQFNRPLAFLAMVVGTVVILSGSPAQAGVMLRWLDGSSAISVDWTAPAPAAGCGALS